MGLIPLARSREHQKAFDDGIIKPNGFVPIKNRHVQGVECISKCKFDESPVALAVKIIDAHHEFLRKESHVASILEKGFKVTLIGGDSQ